MNNLRRSGVARSRRRPLSSPARPSGRVPSVARRQLHSSTSASSASVPSAASSAETSAAASAAAAADKVARGLAATHPHVHVFLHLWRRATLSHLATLQRGQSLETPSAVAPGHLVLQREWPPFVNDYL